MTLLNIEKKTVPSQSCSTEACGVDANAVRYVRPAYRIHKGDSSYEVSVDVPGVSKGGLDITLEDGVLEIKAQRAWKQPEGWKVHGNVKKSAYSLKLEVSDDVDTESIGAQLEHGVLIINLSKKEEKLPRKISIA
tara:strand:- start:942 stop:1346 length:405 start_codon:yes stop_codon:yes gene_type:complete